MEEYSKQKSNPLEAAFHFYETKFLIRFVIVFLMSLG